MPARLPLLAVLLLALAACGGDDPPPPAEPALPADVTPALKALLSEVDTLPPDEIEPRAVALAAGEPGTVDALIGILRAGHTSRAQRGRALVLIESLGPITMPALLDFFLASDQGAAERAYVAIRHVLPTACSWIASEPYPFARRWSDAHKRALEPFESKLIGRARGGTGNARRYAVLIIASLPSEARTAESIPILTDAVMHDDVTIVNDAACALMASADIADEAVPRLLRLMDTGDEDARELALAVLERIGQYDVAVSDAFLIRAKQTTDDELKCSLLVAVSGMGPLSGGAVPLLRDEMMSGHPQRMQDAANCLVAIGKDPKSGAVEGLVHVLDEGSLAARILAVRTLGRLGSDVTAFGRESLRAAAESEDPDLAAAAQAALEALDN